MENSPFIILLPLFILAGFGYALTKIFDLSEDTLVRVLTDCFMPLLVFYSLYTSNLEARESLHIAGASTFVTAFLAFLCLLYCKITGQRYAVFTPPVIFGNSGFLGIPLMELWKGYAAVNMIVIYDQVMTFWIFTLGIAIVTGGLKSSGLKEMAKSPLLWAIVAGFTAAYTRIRIPAPVMEIVRFGGSGASALAAFLLGCSVSRRRIVFDVHIISGTLMRHAGGFLAGLLACGIFNIHGSARQIIIVASALPSAVFSFVLPVRYGIDSEHPGSMVLITTALGLVTVPLLLYLVNIL